MELKESTCLELTEELDQQKVQVNKTEEDRAQLREIQVQMMKEHEKLLRQHDTQVCGCSMYCYFILTFPTAVT